jgi:DNA-binding MarR family transcriptional regulator
LEGEWMSQTSETLASKILDIIPLIMQSIRAEMRKHRAGDLSVVQFRALGYLRGKPGSSLAELAEHIGLTPPTTSALVDGLVSKRLLLRADSPNDRRRVELRLSDAGCAVWEDARRGAQESLVARLDGMSAEERQRVYQAMETLGALYTAEAE